MPEPIPNTHTYEESPLRQKMDYFIEVIKDRRQKLNSKTPEGAYAIYMMDTLLNVCELLHHSTLHEFNHGALPSITDFPKSIGVLGNIYLSFDPEKYLPPQIRLNKQVQIEKQIQFSKHIQLGEAFKNLLPGLFQNITADKLEMVKDNLIKLLKEKCRYGKDKIDLDPTEKMIKQLSEHIDFLFKTYNPEMTEEMIIDLLKASVDHITKDNEVPIEPMFYITEENSFGLVMVYLELLHQLPEKLVELIPFYNFDFIKSIPKIINGTILPSIVKIKLNNQVSSFLQKDPEKEYEHRFDALINASNMINDYFKNYPNSTHVIDEKKKAALLSEFINKTKTLGQQADYYSQYDLPNNQLLLETLEAACKGLRLNNAGLALSKEQLEQVEELEKKLQDPASTIGSLMSNNKTEFAAQPVPEAAVVQGRDNKFMVISFKKEMNTIIQHAKNSKNSEIKNLQKSNTKLLETALTTAAAVRDELQASLSDMIKQTPLLSNDVKTITIDDLNAFIADVKDHLEKIGPLQKKIIQFNKLIKTIPDEAPFTPASIDEQKLAQIKENCEIDLKQLEKELDDKITQQRLEGIKNGDIGTLDKWIAENQDIISSTKSALDVKQEKLRGVLHQLDELNKQLLNLDVKILLKQFLSEPILEQINNIVIYLPPTNPISIDKMTVQEFINYIHQVQERNPENLEAPLQLPMLATIKEILNEHKKRNDPTKNKGIPFQQIKDNLEKIGVKFDYDNFIKILDVQDKIALQTLDKAHNDYLKYKEYNDINKFFNRSLISDYERLVDPLAGYVENAIQLITDYQSTQNKIKELAGIREVLEASMYSLSLELSDQQTHLEEDIKTLSSNIDDLQHEVNDLKTLQAYLRELTSGFDEYQKKYTEFTVGNFVDSARVLNELNKILASKLYKLVVNEGRHKNTLVKNTLVSFKEILDIRTQHCQKILQHFHKQMVEGCETSLGNLIASITGSINTEEKSDVIQKQFNDINTTLSWLYYLPGDIKQLLLPELLEKISSESLQKIHSGNRKSWEVATQLKSIQKEGINVDDERLADRLKRAYRYEDKIPTEKQSPLPDTHPLTEPTRQYILKVKTFAKDIQTNLQNALKEKVLPHQEKLDQYLADRANFKNDLLLKEHYVELQSCIADLKAFLDTYYQTGNNDPIKTLIVDTKADKKYFGDNLTPLLDSILQTIEPSMVTPPDISMIPPDLKVKIDEMENYGVSVQKEDNVKGQVAIDLANELRHEAAVFFTKYPFDPTKQNDTGSKKAFEQFDSRFTAILNSKNKIMDKHRAYWKIVVLNVAIAMSIVGSFILAGYAAYNRFFVDPAKRHSIFLDHTHRKQTVQKVGQAFNEFKKSRNKL